MKKLLAFLLAAAMLFTLAACGSKKKDETTKPSDNVADTTTKPSDNADDTTTKPSDNADDTTTKPSDNAADTTTKPSDNAAENTGKPDGGEADVKIESALALLEKVWDSYSEADKFPASGGDYDNMVMDKPANFKTSDAAAFNSLLGVPEANAAMIDDAASLMHMMNANTFTGGAYHVAKAEDVDTLALAIKDNILARQWMCGFPDKLVVITVGDYVISAFGNAEIMDTFKANVVAQYPTASVAYEENIL